MVLTYGGVTFSKMIRVQLHRLHFSDIAKDVVVALSVCVITALQCATFGRLACPLYLNPQEMEIYASA